MGIWPNNNRKKKENIKYDYLFKIIFLGDSNVGKTSIILRAVNDEFFLEKKNIKSYFLSKYVNINEKINRLLLYDYQSDTNYSLRCFMKGSRVLILLYDISNRKSFSELNHWIKIIEEKKSSGLYIKVLLGNKCDLKEKRMITEEEGRKFANEHDMLFFETSAKTNTNLEIIFNTLCEKLLELTYKNERIKPIWYN